MLLIVLNARRDVARRAERSRKCDQSCSPNESYDGWSDSFRTWAGL